MRIVDYIDRLPDVYRKDEDSNNYKLLLLEERAVFGFSADIDAVQDTLDIKKATGKTLDLYGETYGHPRGKATDEQYRYLITQKVAQNMVSGDYNGIISAISVAFGVPVTEFKLVETETPCTVKVVNMPYSVLVEAGMTVDQMREIIKGLLPVGVTLELTELAGTFEFGTAEMEQDANRGFGNAAQTVGGYFGYLVST